MENIVGDLLKLPNIGKNLEIQLINAGIDTKEKLLEKGSKQAWLDIKIADVSACFNRLCALEGAIQGVRWHDLSVEVKEELKDFYNFTK